MILLDAFGASDKATRIKRDGFALVCPNMEEKAPRTARYPVPGYRTQKYDKKKGYSVPLVQYSLNVAHTDVLSFLGCFFLVTGTFVICIVSQ